MNGAKPLFAVVFVFLLAASTVQAQESFRFEAEVTEATGPAGDLYLFHCELENTSGQDDIYIIEFLDEDAEMPETWQTNICTHETCYAYVVRSVEDPLAAGEVDDLLSIDFRAVDENWDPLEGTGVMPVRISSTNNPDDFVETTFTFHAELSDVGDELTEQPAGFQLMPVYPNPFNSTARVAFNLPRTQRVELTLYNTNGQRLSSLMQGTLPAGHHERAITLAKGFASGVYLIRLEAGELQQVQRAVLVR